MSMEMPADSSWSHAIRSMLMITNQLVEEIGSLKSMCILIRRNRTSHCEPGLSGVEFWEQTLARPVTKAVIHTMRQWPASAIGSAGSCSTQSQAQCMCRFARPRVTHFPISVIGNFASRDEESHRM